MPIKGIIKSPLGKINGGNIGTQMKRSPVGGKEPPTPTVSGRSSKLASHFAGLRPTRGKRFGASRGLDGKARI